MINPTQNKILIESLQTVDYESGLKKRWVSNQFNCAFVFLFIISIILIVILILTTTFVIRMSKLEHRTELSIRAIHATINRVIQNVKEAQQAQAQMFAQQSSSPFLTASFLKGVLTIPKPIEAKSFGPSSASQTSLTPKQKKTDKKCIQTNCTKFS